MRLAGGEIGPKALAGNETCVFQKGNAAIQGFTTVFVLFIVPKIDHTVTTRTTRRICCYLLMIVKRT